MGQTLFASFTVTVLAAALSLGMAVMLTRARVALTSALAQRDRAVVAEASTMRTLRLAVGDLQDVGMRLLGHAEQISLRGNEPVQDVTGVLAMTRQLLDLADAMQDHAVARPSTRALKTETIPLEPFISDAIASVTASRIGTLVITSLAMRNESSTGTALPMRMLSVRVNRAVLKPRRMRPTSGRRSSN